MEKETQEKFADIANKVLQQQSDGSVSDAEMKKVLWDIVNAQDAWNTIKVQFPKLVIEDFIVSIVAPSKSALLVAAKMLDMDVHTPMGRINYTWCRLRIAHNFVIELRSF